MLKQSNQEELKKKADAVSDPNSSEYGKFLTKEEVDALTATQPDQAEAVSFARHGGDAFCLIDL